MLVEPAISPEELSGVLDSRSGPGIIVAYPNRTYINEKASQLIKTLQGSHLIQERRRILPAVITDLCKEVCRVLKDDSSAKDLEQQEFRRVVGSPDTPLLLRALRLPVKGAKDAGAVLIILEPIRQKASVSRLSDRFGFTKRERTVVEDLIQGRTNKEIASDLGISLPSVKAHLKQIMRKTNTTTRTGVLAQILQ
jgi:DNA-binding CsgD family transcriptional regulator